jgi:hypothetical protein
LSKYGVEKESGGIFLVGVFNL